MDGDTLSHVSYLPAITEMDREEYIVVWMFFALALVIPEVFDLSLILSLDFCRN